MAGQVPKKRRPTLLELMPGILGATVGVGIGQAVTHHLYLLAGIFIGLGSAIIGYSLFAIWRR